MRILLIALLMTSCSLLDSGKSLLTGTYEAGKARGRMEVLDDLSMNKKKLEPLRLMIINLLHQEEYKELGDQWKMLTMVIGPLLIERQKLKKELEAAKKNADQTL